MSAPCPTCLPQENKCGDRATCDERGELTSNSCVCNYARRPANVGDGYRLFVEAANEYIVIVAEGVDCDTDCVNREPGNLCAEVPDIPGQCTGGKSTSPTIDPSTTSSTTPNVSPTSQTSTSESTPVTQDPLTVSDTTTRTFTSNPVLTSTTTTTQSLPSLTTTRELTSTSIFPLSTFTETLTTTSSWTGLPSTLSTGTTQISSSTLRPFTSVEPTFVSSSDLTSSVQPTFTSTHDLTSSFLPTFISTSGLTSDLLSTDTTSSGRASTAMSSDSSTQSKSSRESHIVPPPTSETSSGNHVSSLVPLYPSSLFCPSCAQSNTTFSTVTLGPDQTICTEDCNEKQISQSLSLDAFGQETGAVAEESTTPDVNNYAVGGATLRAQNDGELAGSLDLTNIAPTSTSGIDESRSTISPGVSGSEGLGSLLDGGAFVVSILLVLARIKWS